ncbi:arylacetamide deacetylase-like [Diadema antillarum]|uniref:arylacetamide deacetylase-like n=1 Tax=Diadema antillarum TaxID=105358 RepID=UPI003A860E9F
MTILALTLGVLGAAVLAVLLLLGYIALKLPRLPAEIDSKWQTRYFLLQNGIFLLYLYVRGKLNGKPFLVNARESAGSVFKPKPSVLPSSNIKSSVKNFDGVRVRFYEPIERADSGDLPALIFIHGGGFMFGSADMYDPVTRKMAETIKGIVISIDYRLAPENPFPAGFDDCMTAIRHFGKNLAQFGVDPARIAVCGDSAGANLAAGLVQELCSETKNSPNLIRPKLQVLLYPVLQMFDLETPSYQKHNAAFGVTGGFLPTSSVAWMLPRYLTGAKDGAITKALLKGSARAVAARESPVLREVLNHNLVPMALKYPGYKPLDEALVDDEGKESWEKLRSSVQDHRINPLFTEELGGLPPAYIVTCDFDVLRDDGTMYAARLRKAGVEAVLENYVGALHGLMFFPQFKWGHEARKKFYTFLSENL